jgi:peptidoglycan/xylan/chitin deacetylase (PgdA/CDA1 family)
MGRPVNKRKVTIVAACLYYSGLVPLARWWMRRSGRHVIILNYHRASSGKNLRSHIRYLQRAYCVLPLEQALNELFASSNQTNRDARSPIVLTFDDGYHDNYTHAAALACELQAPLTVFLLPGYVNRNIPFWWRAGERLVAAARVEQATIEGRAYHLNLAEERCLLERVVYERAYYARSVAEREAFLASVQAALGVSTSSDPADPLRSLTWEEVRLMGATGWISFGAHTMHHPILGNLADPREVEHEVQDCRTVLEQRLGCRVSAFAYPCGRMKHIGNHGLEAVEKAGYQWAVTTERGINTPAVHPLLLRRIVVDDGYQHWLFLAADIAGVWPFLLRVAHRLRKIARRPTVAPQSNRDVKR